MATLKIKLKGQDHLPFIAGEDQGFDLYQLDKAYTVLSPTRGDVPEQTVELDDDRIIEFEFEDDTVWMGDSESLHSLFPQELKRSASGDELYLPDELASEFQDRGVFKKVAIRLVKIFVKKNIIPPKIKELATKLENKQLAFPGESFEKIGHGLLTQCSTAIELSPLKFGRDGAAKLKVDDAYVLLLHGTASSTQSSFGDLGKSDQWQKLFDDEDNSGKYKADHILAFQHRTLTSSPLENILVLVKSLPANIKLDLLSQSRGGLLAELLARFCAGEDKIGFDKAEKELFTKHKRAKELEDIAAISKIVKEKNIQVRSMVRVAAPANGTTLASGRLNIYLNVTFNLVGLAVGHVGNPVFVAFKEFIMAAVACKDDADVLPGLEAMNPKSPFIKALNNQATEVKIDFPLLVVGGSAELSFTFKTLVVLLGKFFFLGKNDLVVDTESMKWGSPRKDDQVGIYMEESGKIDHFKYFCSPQTLTAIAAGLAAQPGKFPAEYTLRSNYGTRGSLGIEQGSYVASEVSGDKPILILIPGIMGSNIGKSPQAANVKEELIWINYLGFFRGGLSQLKLGENNSSDLNALSLIKTSYHDLGKKLAETYDVVTFQFDWRKPLKDTAAVFERKIDELLKKEQPIKIVAHSMGGVLVRDFMVYYSKTWNRLNTSVGFRGIFLGSPLGGSFRIPYVLFGKDSLIKLLGKIDIRHSTKELLQYFCDFPGILNLLPIDPNGKFDFSDPKLWQKMRTAHGDEGWPIPDEGLLAEFGEHQRKIWSIKEPLDFSNFTYIAGQSGKKSFTVSNMEIDKGKLEFFATHQGDESVTWASGIPGSMMVNNQVYYANVTHGSLAKEKNLFRAIEELLIFGSTKRLQNSLPTTRGDEKEFTPTETEIFDISEENLVSTVLGIAEPEEIWQNEKPISVLVTNGDLKYARYPVLAGHFENDVILNAEAAIDKHLGGELGRLFSLGLYPGKIGSNQIVLNESAAHSGFKGGIIVGLGVQGELSSFYLINSVEKGVARYLTIKKHQEYGAGNAAGFQLNGISVIAIANNYGGLSTDNSIRAIIAGVQRANRNVQQTYQGTIRGIEEIEIIELYNDRALSILKTIQRLNDDDQKDFNISFKENGLRYCLGKRKRVPFDYSSDWWSRITVVHQPANDLDENSIDKLRMSITTTGASEKMEAIPSSDQTLDMLLQQMTVDNRFSPEIATAMFELLVPYQFKEEIKRLNNINWVLDPSSAAYPWEMLLDHVDGDPLCVNIGMVRQLTTSDSRGKIAKVTETTALVVGDPMLGDFMPQLPGAKQEAIAIGNLLRSEDYQITSLINTQAKDIILAMFSRNHKIIHLAGHGVFRHGPKKSTGMVIGNNTFLTPGQIAGMSSSAELIFVNCCYLGQVDNTAELMSQQSNKFAANIGTQLINNGARAVIVAGWAVDDAAALTFSKVFYGNMFSGYGFGESVKRARNTIYKSEGKRTNTWGAFQCYGDPFYKLNEGGHRSDRKDDLSVEEIEIELENMLEMLSANEFDYDSISGRMEKVRTQAERIADNNAEILELMAGVYAGLMNYEKACAGYKKLFSTENAGYSVKAFEQYCNIRAKFALANVEKGKLDASQAAIELDTVIKKLQDLTSLLGETGERISLLGSTYKRKLQLSLAQELKVDLAALDSAIDAYERASNKCKNSDPYPLCNWLILLQLKFWLEKKLNFSKTQQEAVTALNKLLENATKNIKPHNDYWAISHYASMSLTAYFLDQKVNADKVSEAYLLLWAKAGHKGHKAAELEHLKLVSAILAKLPPQKQPQNSENETSLLAAELLKNLLDQLN
ncbi:CHAT domain-containing protein [Algoriphagus locisalis]|uniref:CHAT domain-containing protein n=1 Tax=Algoriphagus locisalis TaxID=305507 RepID=A0A1I6Y2N4_9BACT|nr:CHAT domain-containing protein [Algoriphagus locisalis]SFT44875.1 CHAT domain-containing protein [Algoriphagus locisalis]